MSKGKKWHNARGAGTAIHQAMQRGEAIPAYRPPHLERLPGPVTITRPPSMPQGALLEIADALHRLRAACLVLWDDDSPSNAELDAACGEADEALKHPAIAAARAAQLSLPL